jgi:hypothetical protein
MVGCKSVNKKVIKLEGPNLMTVHPKPFQLQKSAFVNRTAISRKKTASSFQDGAFFVIQEESTQHPLRGAPVRLACVDSS